MVDVRDEILKKILDSMTITDKGVIQWRGFGSSEYKRYLSLLVSELMLDNKVQSKLHKLRYGLTSENDVFFGSELNPIFKEMKEEKKDNYSEFKTKLDFLLEKIKQDSKPEKFELYYPINIKTDKNIDAIKFRDVEIEIKSYEEIKDLLEDETLKEKFKFQKLTKSKYKYIKVILYARNKNFAEQTATKYANLILGFISYSQNYGNSSVTIIGIPKELTQLKANYIFVFKSDNFQGYYFFEDKSDDKKVYELSKADISNLNKFVEKFNKADSKIQEILFKTINLYYSGLTEKRINYSFLNFWTALEIIALKKKGIPHFEIIKRLKSILVNLKPLEEHKIDRIYSLRNNLIHDGAYNISQYDRNLMKIYLEFFIEFFLFNLTGYNIQEIQTIFQFMQKDNTTLKNSKSLIDFVIKLRENDKK
jgi:hypothetical protein